MEPHLFATPPRVAYVILGSPFKKGNDFSMHKRDGPVPPTKMLWLHVWALTALCHNLAKVFVMLPSDPQRAEMTSYAQLGRLPQQLPCPLETVRIGNNTLGSYGMYLHAYEISRNEGFTHYIFAEVDYLPILPRFDMTLAVMHDRAFPAGKRGALVGIVQGEQVEPDSMYDVHPEGSHIMSARNLKHVFKHVYGGRSSRGGGGGGEEQQRPWLGSTADYMVNITIARKHRLGIKVDTGDTRFNLLQEGFGLLLKEAGLEQVDWTAAFRSPYWDAFRSNIVDWTGVNAKTRTRLPMRQVLYAPTQLLFLDEVVRCCDQKFDSCRQYNGIGEQTCNVASWWSAGSADCCTKEAIPWSLVERRPTVQAPELGSLPESTLPASRACSINASMSSDLGDVDADGLLKGPPKSLLSSPVMASHLDGICQSVKKEVKVLCFNMRGRIRSRADPAI